MAIKSLVVKVRVDIAGKAHNCQANSKHRIERGDIRLKVKNGRGWDHYCRGCAETIIARDLNKLNELMKLELSPVPISQARHIPDMKVDARQS